MFNGGLKRRVEELERERDWYKSKKEELERAIKAGYYEEDIKKHVEKVSRSSKQLLKKIATNSGDPWRTTIHVNQKTFESYLLESDGYNPMNGYLESPKWYGFTIKIDTKMKDREYKIVGKYEEVGEPCLNCKRLIEEPKWYGYPEGNPKFCDKHCFDKYTS